MPLSQTLQDVQGRRNPNEWLGEYISIGRGSMSKKRKADEDFDFTNAKYDTGPVLVYACYVDGGKMDLEHINSDEEFQDAIGSLTKAQREERLCNDGNPQGVKLIVRSWR